MGDAAPSSPHTPTPPPSSAPSSWRRISHPAIPTFRPNIPNFRAALLGYLGEIELALRSKLGDGEGELEQERATSPETSITSGEDQSFSESDAQDYFSAARDTGQSTSTAIAGPSTGGLRYRLGPLHSGLGASADPASLTATMAETHHNLLAHLSALREEALNYLPSLPSVSVPSVPTLPSTPHISIPSREWLRSLPSRLSAVDPSIGLARSRARLGGFGAGGAGGDSGSIEGARKRMIELVHAMLPSEEWAGWERLGWEEQDQQSISASGTGRKEFKRSRSASLEKRRAEDEEDDEPEYLFPNRTPASAQAYANRRRAVRSKSLGASSFPTVTAGIKRPGSLKRSRTAPTTHVPLPSSASEDEEEELEQASPVDLDDEEDEDEAFIEAHPEVTDTKLTQLAAKSSELGPTVQEALKRSNDGKRLIEYDDLPFVWRNNEHVISGYRFIPLHLKTGPVPLINSAFTMHNETVNIHSHFIPTILIMLSIPLIIYQSPLPNAHFLDTATIVLYLLAAVSCLVSSAGWHVLSGCASKRWFEWGACVDYVGISWLIAASFGTVVYNGFYCHPRTVLFYLSVNFSCGILGSTLPFQKWFNERRNKKYRIAFFLFLCFAMFAPMGQMFYLYGWTEASKFFSPFGMSIIAYLIGLLFYAFHFPECVYPGKFDLWGASHQIWHLGIVIAIILHYRAVFVAHGVRYDYSCAAPDAGVPVAEVVERILRRR